MNGGDSLIANLRTSHAAISAILQSSTTAAGELSSTARSLSCRHKYLSGISAAIAPLQSEALATKALHMRINQAIVPAASFLRAFCRAKRLERRLLDLSTSEGDGGADRTAMYVDCAGRLSEAVAAATAECQPALQRLQDAVDFLGRTKAVDKLKLRRLRDAAAALKAVSQEELQQLRYEGPLDEALLRLQELYEEMLRRLQHSDVGERSGTGDDLDRLGDQAMDSPDWPTLGSDAEIDMLRRLSDTLASNDCLDICIDIFVKIRYRQVAKALMRLNPEYLKTYDPEEIDRMEWESLESSISLWIRHLHVAVSSVLAAEKRLCFAVLSSAMDGAVWPECFAQISDRIMAVFFRFGEGVALSSPEPQKVFRLLEMSSAAARLRPALSLLFDDAAPGIAGRFRELQKMMVHAASQAFAALENLPDQSLPPPDGSVPGVVRYVVNYLKCLADGAYAPAMAHVLRTQSLWKAGFLSPPQPDQTLLRESLARVLDALRANIEGKRARFKDKVAAHLFAMNSYWYMYMRTRGSELARVVGEEEMKGKYKQAAEEAAYAYQEEGWSSVTGSTAEIFLKKVEEEVRRHRAASYKIPDGDLREQIKEAVEAMLLDSSPALPSPQTLTVLIRGLFEQPDPEEQ